MENKTIRKLNKCRKALIFFSMVLALSGCGSEKEDPLVPPIEPNYDAVVPTITVVERGDVTPSYEMDLQLMDYDRKRYKYSLAEYTELSETYELEVEDVLVNVGENVEEGDVMVSFHSKVLDEKIRENQKTINEAALEIEHLKVLQMINTYKDYTYDIEKLERDIEAAALHISDVRETYRRLSMICETDGVVASVNSIVQNGYIKPDTDIVEVVSSAGYYVAPKPGDRTFKTGEKYTATTLVNEYQLEVVDTPEGESSDNVYFKPVGIENMIEKELSLKLELPVQKDVCYVNKNAIVTKDEHTYVFVVNENGLCTAVEVELGEKFDDNVIVKKGLEGGENVALQ